MTDAGAIGTHAWIEAGTAYRTAKMIVFGELGGGRGAISSLERSFNLSCKLEQNNGRLWGRWPLLERKGAAATMTWI